MRVVLYVFEPVCAVMYYLLHMYLCACLRVLHLYTRVSACTCGHLCMCHHPSTRLSRCDAESEEKPSSWGRGENWAV